MAGAGAGVEKFAEAVSKALEEYGDLVYTATEEGLDAAEKVLIGELKAKSPKLSGEYAKSWKSKGKKYKLRRYVGNAKTVRGGRGGEIPLSNILEYGSESKHQGEIKRIFDGAADEMAAAVIAKIKEV